MFTPIFNKVFVFSTYKIKEEIYVLKNVHIIFHKKFIVE